MELTAPGGVSPRTTVPDAPRPVQAAAGVAAVLLIIGVIVALPPRRGGTLDPTLALWGVVLAIVGGLVLVVLALKYPGIRRQLAAGMGIREPPARGRSGRIERGTVRLSFRDSADPSSPALEFATATGKVSHSFDGKAINGPGEAPPRFIEMAARSATRPDFWKDQRFGGVEAALIVWLAPALGPSLRQEIIVGLEAIAPGVPPPGDQQIAQAIANLRALPIAPLAAEPTTRAHVVADEARPPP